MSPLITIIIAYILKNCIWIHLIRADPVTVSAVLHNYKVFYRFIIACKRDQR